MDFISIDVETANPDLSSICQIGVVQFRGGKVAHCWETLVNPRAYFDPMNVSVHGIRKADVSDAPTFPDIATKLHRFLTKSIVCHHSPFDRTAIQAVHSRYRIALPRIQWLDTARVVRRTWHDRSRSGYGLHSVAKMLGISFTHHDAGEDARAAGEVLLHAIRKSGCSVSEWIKRSRLAITDPIAKTSGRRTRSGNPEGPLCGETAVFTGMLSMTRRVAADMAAAAGCNVGNDVTAATTLLVVGDQDVARLAGKTKSAKHLKAEAKIKNGQLIRILKESDFQRLLKAVEQG